MSDSELIFVGNPNAEPDVKYLPGGTLVAEFTIASTPRSFDKTSAGGGAARAPALRGGATRKRKAADRHAARELAPQAAADNGGYTDEGAGGE